VDIFSISQSKKDLNRISQILDILVKFQLDEVANRLRLGERLPIRLRKPRVTPEIVRTTPEERMRLMLEELGTTFVKFGQLLSTRRDIIGATYAAELAKLQDSMKPFPTEKAREIVAEELGKPISEIFSFFEGTPIASASVGQVHRATLKDGTKVVVKVQRPGIEDTIKSDLRLMHYLAGMVNKHVPEFRKYDPVYLVNEFDRSIMKELDFQRESKNAERLGINFKGDPGIHIPAVFENLCTKRVMVMEELRGAKLSDIISGHSKKYDNALIARRCVRAFFKMVLVDGFYHGDMHPGNIMILGRNVVGLLDFGRVDRIDKEVAERMLKLALFAVEGDVNGLVEHMIRTGMIKDTANTDSFKADVSDVLDQYYSVRIVDVKMGQMLSDLVDVLGRYEFNRPRELAELTRSLLIVEGMCNELDPRFNIAEEFEPYAKKILPGGWDPLKLMEIVKNDMLDFEYVARSLPTTVRRFLSKMEEGKLRIELAHRDLDVFTEDLDRISDKMSLAMIVAALIVGSSLVIRTSSIIGLTGFVASAVLGIWLAFKALL
jgi:ubiquinone biosynthesis protein